MFKLKKHLIDEHGKIGIEYVIGLFVLVAVVIIFWQTWCLLAVKIVDPIFSIFGSPGISTETCNAKIDLKEVESLDIPSWENVDDLIEKISLPPLSQSEEEFLKSAAPIVAVALVITILAAQLYSKLQDAIKRTVRHWYKAITNFLLPIWNTAKHKVRDWSEILLLRWLFQKIKPHTRKGVIDVISILCFAAEPTNASRVRLGEELREIREKLQLAKLRERFELEDRMAVRPADISQALLDVQPQIVHFSGHGTSTGALCFENQVGQVHLVQPDALAALFEQFAHKVNCVLLNACYSETQAKAIAKHIKYVIGMNQAIDDKAAIAFTVGFYQALGAGRTIEDAYKLGCVQIRLQSIPEHLTPVLIKKGATQL
jgi:hypothetical protein